MSNHPAGVTGSEQAIDPRNTDDLCDECIILAAEGEYVPEGRYTVNGDKVCTDCFAEALFDVGINFETMVSEVKQWNG